MEKRKILIVEDDKDVADFLEEALSKAGFMVFRSDNAMDVLVSVIEIMPDLILLDITLPAIDGLEAKKKLNTNKSTAGIPVIFLTSRNSVADKVEGLGIGADDYITKPCSLEELLARINSVLNRRSFYEEISMTDGLTGLYNTYVLKKQLSSFFRMARIYKRIFSVVIIDIDRFKGINDNYGHNIGDLVLKKIASIAKETLRRSDIIIRYGGDEFAVILPDADEKAAESAVKKLNDRLVKDGFVIDDIGQNVSFTVSIGFATYNDSFMDETQLFAQADTNMYDVKKAKVR